MDSSKRPVLSISLLVSNGRLDTIRKCMESLTPLRNEVKCELVVVDTGSKDGSIEIAREYADLVVPFTWCNDFSAARNAGLQRCTGEWFLYLDDDEWFDDVSEIILFFKSGEYKKYDCGWYLQRNYNDYEGTSFADYCAGRMCKIVSETRFIGRIHEYLVPLSNNVKIFQTFVHHYGYVYRTEEERQKHLQRNLVLEEAAVKENPEDIRMCCQLVQEYRAARRFEDAEALSRKTLETTKYDIQNNFVQYLLLAIPKSMIEQGNSEKAEEELTRLADISGFYIYSRIAIQLELAMIHARNLKYEKVLECVQKMINIYDTKNITEPGHPVMDFAYYVSKEALQKAIRMGLIALVNSKRFDTAADFIERIDWNCDKTQLMNNLNAVFQTMQATGNTELFFKTIDCYFEKNKKGEEFCQIAEFFWEQFPRIRNSIAEAAVAYEGNLVGFWKVLHYARKHYNGDSLKDNAISYYANEDERKSSLLESLLFENQEAFPIVLVHSDLEDWSQLCSLYVKNRDAESLVEMYNSALQTEGLFAQSKKAYFHVKCSIIAEKIMLLLPENHDESIKKNEKNADIYSMETLRTTLGEYVFHMTKYADEIYRSELFDDELCYLLPKNLQFVKWIAEAYQNEDDFSAWGQGMKKAAKVYPVFLPVVRMLINDRADKEKNKKVTVSQADELQKLSNQMKQMIESYIQNGQYTEAKQLLDEVEQIMPNEDWIRELHTELL